MFMCQRDSFLTEFETEIISCEPVTELDAIASISIDPKKILENETQKLYKVILKDTILFPEGGGQPDDRGLINDEKVLRVLRDGNQAIHYLAIKSPSDIKDDSSISSNCPSSGSATTSNGLQWWLTCKSGDKALTKIDWQRRFDHMQQHSGQHLITAVTDAFYGYPTTSWWLGSEDCYIELDTKDITREQIKTIEDEVNTKIRQCTPVTVDVVELNDPKLQKARGRNLPADIKGQIRIITMAGVESNVCCGTHVTNLSQLQVIKLLNVVKKKGKCLLYFLCGNRVIDKFSKQFEMEQKLTEVLKSSPTDLAIAAEKLNVTLKNSRKTCQTLNKDLAALIAKDYKANANSGEKLWWYHRVADLDFGTTLLREIGNIKSKIVLITLKAEGNSGSVLLTGSEDVISRENLTKLGEALCSVNVLDGKGTIQKGSTLFQAKVSKISAVNKAVKIAQELINEWDKSVES